MFPTVHRRDQAKHSLGEFTTKSEFVFSQGKGGKGEQKRGEKQFNQL